MSESETHVDSLRQTFGVIGKNMSGGAYDYRYAEISRLADDIEERLDATWTGEALAPDVDVELRKRFVVLLRKVAKAARTIEWTDSGDSNVADEIKAIRSAFNNTP